MADEDEKWNESVERASRPLPFAPVNPNNLLGGIRNIQQAQRTQQKQAESGRSPQTTVPPKTTSGREQHPPRRSSGLISGFDGVGSTPTRKLFWNQVADTVNASRKLEGTNVSIIEHPGQGSLINVPDRKTTAGCCPSDITGIGGFQMAGLFVDGGSSCSLSGSSWVRINRDAAFSAPQQFKLYLDEACVVQYEDNRESSPITACCSPGAFTGCFNFTSWFTVLTSPLRIVIGFNLSANFGVSPPCVATHADEEITIPDICDWSFLQWQGVDDHRFEASSDCGNPDSFFIGGSLRFFPS